MLVDASRRMLLAAASELMVQAAFEALPFRDGAFGSVVAGFSLRDSRDLFVAVEEVRRVTAAGGRFALCDLGKPDSFLKAVILGTYIRVGVPVIGAITGGRTGLGFVSLYDTYLLTMKNGFLSALLGTRFSSVDLRARQLAARSPSTAPCELEPCFELFEHREHLGDGHGAARSLRVSSSVPSVPPRDFAYRLTQVDPAL